MNNVENDLTKIFDRRWKINKETSKKISEHNKELNSKLFESKNPNIEISKESDLERLNRQMNNLKNMNRNKFGG